jgi:putative oxidoreductase
MQKLIQFCLQSAGTHSNRGDWGILILRFFFGLTMALSHGMDKTPPSEGFIVAVASMGFPFASFFAWLAALSESIGGLLIAIGLFTRPAAFFLLQTMLVAALIKHGGDPFKKMEMALLFASFSLSILLIGAGRWSLDARLWKVNTTDNTDA